MTYRRGHHLPPLIAIDPEATTQRIVEVLSKAVEGEWRRGVVGHWAYDTNRHIALIQALRAETEQLNRENAKNYGEAA